MRREWLPPSEGGLMEPVSKEYSLNLSSPGRLTVCFSLHSPILPVFG